MSGLGEALQAYWNEQVVAQASDLVTRLVVALLATGFTAWMARLALRGTRRTLQRAPAHANARLLIDRLIQFGFLLFGALWVLSILGVQLTGLVAVLGVGGLAASLALQDVLKNLIAGLYILIERPFTIGEHIEFRTFSGIVETIRLRTTVLRTLAGQQVVIPNAMLFAEALVNRSAYGRQLVKVRVAVPLAAPAPATAETGKVEVKSGPAGPPPQSSELGAPTRVEPAPRATREGVPDGERPGMGCAAGTSGPNGAGGEAPAGPGERGERGERGEATAIDGQAVTEEIRGAIREAAQERQRAEGPAPLVQVESLSEAKLTLRAELWTSDVQRLIPSLVWAMRRRLPQAEITVLE
ncbi:MAG TPA: mechanosensitive ion channel family protein [Chloroflexota bacterium]|nr:mechanosensitive ion channel family protein [Chloroflexota bacterium]